MAFMGKVVLSYSRDHFDPQNANNPFGGSGFIAREFYNQLKISFPEDELIYLDYRDYKKVFGMKDVKLLIGISENLNLLAQIIKPERTIMIAVNKPWIQRRKIFVKAEQANFPIRWLSVQDGLRSYSHELKGVDEVISLGDFANYQEYSQLIGDSSRVFPINFNRLKISTNSAKKTRTVLFFSGEISFRKGIDLIEKVLPFMVEQNLKLKIVGNSPNVYLNAHLNELAIKFSNNFEHERQWITFSSPEWEKMRDEVSFAIFPSREEGQASVLAELISEGIPTIYTRDSGLDWPHTFVQPKNSEYRTWQEAILMFSKFNALELNLVLKQQQQILGMLGHESAQIQKLVKRIANGKLWPNYVLDETGIISDIDPESYVIHKRYDFINPVEIEISMSSCFKSDSIERDLIAVVDKYQNVSQFQVRFGLEIFGIERIQSVPKETYASEVVRLTSNSSEALFESRLYVTFLRKLGPWIYDRRLTRFHFRIFATKELYRKFVSICSSR